MPLSGPSALLPQASASGGGGYAAPPQQQAPIPNQTQNLNPSLLGAPAWQGSMANNGPWNGAWNQAYNQWKLNPNANNQTLVHMVRMGYSPDQVVSALRDNTIGKAQAQQGQQTTALNGLIQQQLQSDPTMAGADQAKALLGLTGGLQNQQFDLQRQQLQADTKNSLDKLQLQGTQAADSRKRAVQSIDAVNRAYGVDIAGAHTQFDSNLQGLYSTATANGAVTTGGTKDQRSTFQQQLVEGIGGAGASRDLSLARYNSMLDNANAQSKQVGLDSQTYMNSLNFGLQNIGLSQNINAVDLMDKANSTDATKAAAAQSVIQNLISLAQQNPQLLQQYIQQSGMSSPGGAPHPVGSSGGSVKRY